MLPIATGNQLCAAHRKVVSPASEGGAARADGTLAGRTGQADQGRQYGRGPAGSWLNRWQTTLGIRHRTGERRHTLP